MTGCKVEPSRTHSLDVPYRRVPARALGLSLCALAVPVLAATLFSGGSGQQVPLLGLLLLVPGFLMAYYRGWRGAALAHAVVMTVFVLAHLLLLWRGGALPATPLMLGVVAALTFSFLGAGWLSEMLHRRLFLAQEDSRHLVLVTDGQGINAAIKYVSPSIRGILGYTAESLENSRLVALLESGASAQTPDSMPLPGEVAELRVLHADGSPRMLEVEVEDKLSDPRVAGLVYRARDVTERLAGEEQRRKRVRMQAVAELAGMLAHDFNNVLTAIRGNAALMQDEVKGNQALAQGLAEIVTVSRRASGIVDQLLAFTRQQVLRPEALNPNGVISEMAPALQRLLGPATELELDLAEHVPSIFMDPGQFRRGLLIDAAWRAERMPAGGTFRIRTEARQLVESDAARFAYSVLPGQYVAVTTVDSGPSLSAAARAHLFEPFSVLLGEDSSGLELPSLYGTIKQSGGYIWAEDGVQGGVELRIVLPVAVSELGQVAPPRKVTLHQEGGSGVVLVAEDDVHVRAVVCRVLLKQGYYVLEAADGEEAVRLARGVDRQLDMVVTDLLMPGMDGRDLACSLREQWPDLPVLFMSGQRNGDSTYEGDPVQDEVFIRKPFSPVELSEKLLQVRSRGVS